uniref:Uncharacterized protein n=1 Tax=Phasianus colchicus TaxID=9054 RepID=A0A669QQ25_PHACC
MGRQFYGVMLWGANSILWGGGSTGRCLSSMGRRFYGAQIRFYGVMALWGGGCMGCQFNSLGWWFYRAPLGFYGAAVLWGDAMGRQFSSMGRRFYVAAVPRCAARGRCPRFPPSRMGATVFVQPLDLVKNRMQLSGAGGRSREYRSSVHAVAAILRREGVRGIYTGYRGGRGAYGDI